MNTIENRLVIIQDFAYSSFHRLSSEDKDILKKMAIRIKESPDMTIHLIIRDFAKNFEDPILTDESFKQIFGYFCENIKTRKNESLTTSITLEDESGIFTAILTGLSPQNAQIKKIIDNHKKDGNEPFVIVIQNEIHAYMNCKVLDF